MNHSQDAVCAHHLGERARHYCTGCRLYYCSECTEHRWVGTGFDDLCRRCSGSVETLKPPATTDTATFVSRLPEALRFPATRGVLPILLGLSLLVGPISWLVGGTFGLIGLFGGFVILGLELSVFFHFVHVASQGEVDEVSTPDFTGVWDDIYGPAGRLLAAFLPLIIVTVWTVISLGSLSLITTSGLHLGALVSVLLLLPLLVIRAVLGAGALDVLNPVGWAQTLSVLGARYFVAALSLYLLWAAYLLWSHTAAVGLLAIPLLGRVLGLLGGYLILAVAAKVIGLLLEPHLRT